MLPIDYLMKCCAEYGILLTDAQAEKMDAFACLLLEWNRKMNLTAITDPKEMVEKHFVDSLLLTQTLAIQEGARLLDVGAGAGFPSVPIAILRPDMQITQLDSLNKRLVFLEEAANKLHLSCQTLHARAEIAGREPAYREQFSIVTARAVAQLNRLSEYCLPFVQVGGFFVAMKGGDIEAELEAAKPAIKLCGGKTRQVKPFSLPDGSERMQIVIEKISQTPTKYPRSSAKITKAPL